METKSIQITSPGGYEVDKEHSTFEKVIFKKKKKTYEDIASSLFNSVEKLYYTDYKGKIKSAKSKECADTSFSDWNNATSEEQVKCILAKNKLANVARYLNGDWNPFTSSNTLEIAYIIFSDFPNDYIGVIRVNKCSEQNNVLFKSRELAEQAIEILGEEEVRLALKPLY